MYGWLWRKLPGRWPVKLVEALVLAAAVSLFLVAVVFPWVEPKLPFSENTVDGSGGSESTGTPAATTAPAPTAPSTTDVPTPQDPDDSGSGGGVPDGLAGE